jgi:hypothetical protein
MNSRVTQIRVMNPRTSGPGTQYPNGYFVYENAGGQIVDPVTGRTDITAHFPWSPTGGGGFAGAGTEEE